MLAFEGPKTDAIYSILSHPIIFDHPSKRELSISSQGSWPAISLRHVSEGVFGFRSLGEVGQMAGRITSGSVLEKDTKSHSDLEKAAGQSPRDQISTDLP